MSRAVGFVFLYEYKEAFFRLKDTETQRRKDSSRIQNKKTSEYLNEVLRF